MNTKTKVFLCISMCVLMAFSCAVFVFAEEVTESAETTAAPTLFDNLFEPAEAYAYRYYTRSGIDWAKDLPASPVTAPFTFTFTRSGGSGSVTVSLYEGDTYYVSEYQASNDRYLFVRTHNGNTSTIPLYAYDTSTSVTYYTDSSTVTTFEGGTLVGEGLYNGGGVPVLTKNIFIVGGKLIDFVMSSWVTLIPLVCFLGVVCVGAIKKLLQGV